MNEFRARRTRMILTKASLRVLFFVAVIFGVYELGLGIYQTTHGLVPKIPDYSSCFLRLNYPPWVDGDGDVGPWGHPPQ